METAGHRAVRKRCGNRLLARCDDARDDGRADRARELLKGVADGVAVGLPFLCKQPHAVRHDVARSKALPDRIDDVDEREGERRRYGKRQRKGNRGERDERAAEKNGAPRPIGIERAAAEGREERADDAAGQQDTARRKGSFSMNELRKVRQQEAEAERNELDEQEGQHAERKSRVAVPTGSAAPQPALTGVRTPRAERRRTRAAREFRG